MRESAQRQGPYCARMWHPADIIDAVVSGLAQSAAERDLEQAVLGIDACDELELHPLIESALSAHGFGVHREQRYPRDRGRRRISEGDRCDFVLSPDARPLQQEDARSTLFESPDACALDEAFWLEVKVVHQYTLHGANAGYASQLLSTVRQDVSKLSRDDGILHAGLLIVLFVASGEVAQHDLRIWRERCLARSLPIGAPYERTFSMTDRLGNACCHLSLHPVHHL